MENPNNKKLKPFLWFDNNAEEAVNLYTSIFKDSKIHNVVRQGETGPGKNESVMTISFELFGIEFVALNGGPLFKFNESVSFLVECESQQEVDDYWTRLTADGGQESRCGWLKDKFGLSWQIIPTVLPKLIGDPDRQRAALATQAMMSMTKIDIGKLQDAFDGK